MPTYHYRCPSCGHDFEKFEKKHVKARPKCPQCGTRAERQISGGAGLLFKGSGFYITDYKKPQGGEPHGESSKAADSGKTDKPAKTEKTSPKSPRKAPGAE
jgi:putative FmdB family regulatory protein